MFYTIYKITNQIDGKFYIGSHKTKNLDDNYMGSGKYLKRAQVKHGLNNFTKELLFVFDNATDMYAKEAEIVNEDFLMNNNTYNIKLGGFGGFDHLNSAEYQNPTHSTEHALKMTKRRLEVHNETTRKEWSRKGGTISATKKVGVHDPSKRGNFKGKTHTSATKQKMSLAARERLKDPTKNSQYNTMWVTNGVSNAKINNNSPIPEGWKRGRTVY